MFKRRSEKITEFKYEQVRSSALRMLTRRDHSFYELTKKLKSRYVLNEEHLENLKSDLDKWGYLRKEGDLAEGWVRQWLNQGRGRYYIENKLKEKGLTLPRTFNDETEWEGLTAYASRKFRSRGEAGKSNDPAQRAKMYRHLLSRGFSGALVAKICGKPGTYGMSEDL